MGICCMAQETHTGALYQPRGLGWGGRWTEGEGHMYACGQFMLIYGRTHHNIVN